MTVEVTDRIKMADSNEELTLDSMFEWLEKMPVPEGYKAEIVEGAIYMSPQRNDHWDMILEIVDQLRAKYAKKRIKSDVRIDYPGHLNGFASDVVAHSADAVMDAKGRWRHQDVEFVAEVISRDTMRNDYGPKKAAYAAAGVPVYVIADPYTGRCRVFEQPKDSEYRSHAKGPGPLAGWAGRGGMGRCGGAYAVGGPPVSPEEQLRGDRRGLSGPGGGSVSCRHPVPGLSRWPVPAGGPWRR